MEEEKQAKYVIKEKNGLYHFELVTPNGTRLLKSETYSSDAGLQNGIALARKYCSTTLIEDKRESKSKK